ncbi:arsenate reductase [Magnetovibrio sp. PR-2]|uniref:arsenate reductase n=1 Tax=Magnetovibrio sp. PR-2 TaxID=3120356 RepID=UPI002FCE1C75
MINVYGIKNCDTVRKALKWLDAQGLEHTFHDVREDGLEAAKVSRWVEALGWESVLNKRSTTWKQLDENKKNSLNETSSVELMCASPTLVKRPVFEVKDLVLNGFTPAVQARLSKKD